MSQIFRRSYFEKTLLLRVKLQALSSIPFLPLLGYPSFTHSFMVPEYDGSSANVLPSSNAVMATPTKVQYPKLGWLESRGILPCFIRWSIV